MTTSREIKRALADVARQWSDPSHPARLRAVEATLGADNRFTEEALAFAINQQMALIEEDALDRWVGGRSPREALTVGVLGAGNVPFADLQDYLAVVLTGHRYVGSPSHRSPVLLKAFAEEVARSGGPEAMFVGTDDVFGRVDALIATGSDETRVEVARRAQEAGVPGSRLLLRGSGFGVAVIDGREDEEERIGLAEDILLHEGLGCRNVAVLFAHESIEPDAVLDAMAVFRGTFPAHPDTSGSLKMQQAFLKAVDAPHAYGEGLAFLVSRGEAEPQAPGHLRWTPYASIEEVSSWLETEKAHVQVVAARTRLLAPLPRVSERCALGDTQRPALDWTPDGIDTIAFLASL